MINYEYLEGTIRACSPSETINKVKPYFSKFGITRVANVTGLDDIDIPVAICCRPNSKSLSVTQGKGLTYDLAKVSSIMEAVEYWHAENLLHTHQNVSAKGLGDKALKPSIWKNDFFELHHFDNIKLDWIKLEEVVTGNNYYAPHKLFSLDNTKLDSLSISLLPNTNGLASGNTLTEASCHALYEVIERDAYAKWLKIDLNSKSETLIKLKTISHDAINFTLEKFKTANVIVKLWDMTTSIKIPTFHCRIYDKDDFDKPMVFAGSGAHIDLGVAVLRALTEAAQSRLTLITGSRDDITDSQYDSKVFRFSEADEKKSFDDCLSIPYSASFKSNYEYVISELVKNGHSNILKYNYTREDIGIPVVRVRIPTLQYNRIGI